MMDYRVLPFGDCAVTVAFEQQVSVEINRQVAALASFLQQQKKSGIVDLIPTYCALTVCFDPDVTNPTKLGELISKGVSFGDTAVNSKKRVHIIPVCYGGELGPDLQQVADLHQMSPEEVVSLHSAKDYLIYMIGFLPGFPYLGGLDERLETPRLASPRTEIPAGSVGIGGKQTGIYPLASPGGWQLIGRTPVKVYDATKNPAVPYAAGEYIRFVPIDEATYARMEEEIKNGTYRHQVEEESI